MEKQAPGLMKEAERFLILSNIDRLWKEHLQALKFVQQAVGLRGYAQRDPLIEYKLEGYNLFLDMMAQIRRNVIYSIYQVRAISMIHMLVYNDIMLLKYTWLFCSKLVWFLVCWQFQPVMVKKDEQQTQNEKSGKIGRSKNDPDPVVVAKSS